MKAQTVLVLVLAVERAGAAAEPAAPGDRQPFVIRLDIAAPKDADDSTGGIVVADVNGDRRGDFLVTTRGHLAVYDNGGEKLWSKELDIVVGGQSESEGLPGHHGPGVAAGDVDGDGRTEVVYLTRDGILHVSGGAKGEEKATARPPVPDGAERWEVAMIASFRPGKGDRDILLQATVAALFQNLKDGASVQDFLEWFPGVKRSQVEAVLDHEAATAMGPSRS